MALFSAVSRLWRRRGHGVHSPFVYQLLRAVYCQKRGGEGATYRALIDKGVDKGVAEILERIIVHCSYQSWSFNSVDGSDIAICSDHARVEDMVAQALEGGITLAIITAERGRYIVDNHPSTSIEAEGYTLLFNNGLPKQIFKV